MNLKVLYYYSLNNFKEPKIDDFIKIHKKYEEFYKNYNDGNLSEPYKIDQILDTYNRRKKEYDEQINYIEIFYLIVDLDNEDALDILIEKTEKDENFRGWVKYDSEEYKMIHKVFMGVEFDKAIKKINDYGKNKNF